MLHNHPSTRQAQNSTFLREYIAKELQHRAIIGPFNHNPFNINCTISAPTVRFKERFSGTTDCP